MKIRNGFVSNSSSSSFVVAFPRVPLNSQDIKEMLFLDIDAIVSPWQENVSISVNEAADIIFNDLVKQSFVPLSKDEIKSEFDELYAIQHVREYINSRTDKERKALDKKSEEHAQKTAEEFLKKNKGCFIYRFTYADDCGPPENLLEQGDIFKNLSHVRISHH